MGKAKERRLSWLARKGLPKGHFYVVNNYGWGDGGCYGPYTAYEALVKLYEDNPIWGTLSEAIQGSRVLGHIFKSHSDSSCMHYISDYDRSEDFEDFISS